MKKILCALLLALTVVPALAEPFNSKGLPFNNSEFLNKFNHVNMTVAKHEFGGTVNDRIVAVNAFVNHVVSYQTETDDVWSDPADTLARGHGDCEDFALLKMAYLFQAGISKQDVSLMIVTLPGHTDYHAVVAVHTGNGFVVLDSATNAVLPDSRTNYIPVYQILNGKGFVSAKKL